MNSANRRQSADLLRRVLDAVERGDLNAQSPRGQAFLRRVEGALLALKALDRPRP